MMSFMAGKAKMWCTAAAERTGCPGEVVTMSWLGGKAMMCTSLPVPSWAGIWLWKGRGEIGTRWTLGNLEDR